MSISLVALLVGLIVLGLAFWATRALLAAFGIGDPIRTVVYVVLVVIAILYFLGLLGLGPSLRLT